MPEKKKPPRPPPAGPRPMWSGTLTFGLVSVPVQLHAATRSARGVSLRMVDQEGVPLSRRYVCPAEDREVSRDELVRGFEVAEGEYVVLTDEELQNVEPRKSREIDLRRFVPVGDLDPVFFERAYILTPGEGSTKAYRLLARTMEATGRAGVATFVMRSKEYLVAIVAENGILTAETMRFHDELRTAEDVGLPDRPDPPRKQVRSLISAIEQAAGEGLDRAELEDERADELETLVAAKLERGESVKRIPGAARGEEEDEEERGDVVDLMAVLRRSLARRGAEGTADETREQEDGALADLTKAELYERAKDLDVSGRSSMSKDELLEAIRGRRRSA